MWQAIQIAEQNYFFKCSAEETSINYYLYNLKEVWSEQCSTSDVIQRAKELNKKISYDAETVLKTIKSIKPTTLTLEDVAGSHVLVQKYHIVGRPFNFEWKLKPLPADDFEKLVTYPLFMSIHYLSEQIKELKETIKKKDNEIEQYKAEGAVLQRTTVGTAKFEEDAFNKRYEKVNLMSKGFLDISERVKACFPTIDSTSTTTGTTEKSNSSTSFIASEKRKRSPGKSKKRSFFEARSRRMQSILKSKKESMDFQSSQSQTPPNDDLAEIFQSLDELNAKRMASTTL